MFGQFFWMQWIIRTWVWFILTQFLRIDCVPRLRPCPWTCCQQHFLLHPLRRVQWEKRNALWNHEYTYPLLCARLVTGRSSSKCGEALCADDYCCTKRVRVVWENVVHKPCKVIGGYHGMLCWIPTYAQPFWSGWPVVRALCAIGESLVCHEGYLSLCTWSSGVGSDVNHSCQVQGQKRGMQSVFEDEWHLAFDLARSVQHCCSQSWCVLCLVVSYECYLVDPASSHMLVSKIKPCMCKYELIQTVKLRMAH